MVDFTVPDVSALQSVLDDMPIAAQPSDKGQFFRFNWWPKHHKEVEKPVLEAIARLDDTSFARRVNILRIAERADANNGKALETMGFTVDEITRYVTRAMNKRLKEATKGSDTYWCIRNNKLIPLSLEHNPNK